MPDESVMIFPVGLIGIPTDFAVGRVTGDPDGAGTCQAQLIQADNEAGTTNVLKLDSVPIFVTATNKYIDISEDGNADVATVITEGVYNSLTLMAEIQTQLNANGGLAGTYTVIHNPTTGITDISVAGLGSGIEIKFGTGANSADSVSRLLGFLKADTAQLTTVLSTYAVDANYYDATVLWEYAADYTEGEDPATSGTWLPMGNGNPSNGGVEGTDGVDCVATPRHIRVNVGLVSALDLRFHGFRGWNGNLRTQAVAL